MAVVVFETATQDQANAFTAADFLVFTNSAASALNVTFAPLASGDAISVTSGGKSLIFSTTVLSQASRNGQVAFNDGSNLITGTNGADDGAGTNPPALAGGTGNDVIYGFGGNDIITTGNGANYAFGGTGADTITGGDNADHLYGQSANGGADGNDSILGGDGNDYIQGNAGDDTLNGQLGSDRIFGGNGNDTILGGAGNDTVNGNLGNDSIIGEDGNDFLRGGNGNDLLEGGLANDQLFGDGGNDSIVGGASADVLTGGDGADTFSFRGTDANPEGIPSGTTTTTFYDTVTDYLDGTDKFNLFATGDTSVYVGATTATFTNIAAARVYAQQLLDAGSPSGGATNEVAAVQVGADTYLFYTNTGLNVANQAIDSIIKLNGVSASNIGGSDFVAG